MTTQLVAGAALGTRNPSYLCGEILMHAEGEKIEQESFKWSHNQLKYAGLYIEV